MAKVPVFRPIKDFFGLMFADFHPGGRRHFIGISDTLHGYLKIPWHCTYSGSTKFALHNGTVWPIVVTSQGVEGFCVSSRLSVTFKSTDHPRLFVFGGPSACCDYGTGSRKRWLQRTHVTFY